MEGKVMEGYSRKVDEGNWEERWRKDMVGKVTGKWGIWKERWRKERWWCSMEWNSIITQKMELRFKGGDEGDWRRGDGGRWKETLVWKMERKDGGWKMVENVEGTEKKRFREKTEGKFM
jgi:hypothetical protein